MNAQRKNTTKRRARGSGRLYKRGNTWWARWTVDGVRVYETTGIRIGERRDGKSDRALAEEWLADRTEPLRIRRREEAIAMLVRRMQSEEQRLSDAVGSVRKKMTLADMSGAFRSSPRKPDCSKSMTDFYCSAVERFARWSGGGIFAEKVGDAQAETYARELSARVSSGTFNKAINALTLVWRVLGPVAGLGTNPWKGIARRRSDAHVRRPLTREETDKMMAEAQGEMRTLVAVCLYTGLRLGDACRLRWEDIRSGVAFVTTAKRDRKVAIPIHPKLAEMLGAPKPGGFVMPGIAARYAQTRQGPSNISRSIKRLMERCGIKTSVGGGDGKGRRRPDATAHSLRHTFVTRAIEAGVPPHVVQAIVGHASATMTERYTHLSDEAAMAAFARMQ